VNPDLKRAVLHDRALADVERAIARAVDSAPSSERAQHLLAHWRPFRTAAANARADLRTQANHRAEERT
jgi:hypothetical protein